MKAWARTARNFFNARDTLPTEDKQHRLYLDLVETFAQKPATIRTLDTGGDKKLPFFTITETNPFLGRRRIRFTLDHTAIFLTQLRAFLRPNAGLGNLHAVVVHVVGDIVQRAHRQDKPVGVCGEMAGDPAPALLLISLVVDSLSMTPSSLPSVKWTIRSVTLRQARGFADRALKIDNEADTHRLLNHALKAAGLSAFVHGNWPSDTLKRRCI